MSMSEEGGNGSPQLSLSGCSSLFSISSSSTGAHDNSNSVVNVAAAARLKLPPPPPPPPPPRLSLCVGAGVGEEEEEEEELQLDLQVGVTSCSCGGDDDERKNIRMMKNRESALRSRARKRAYVQELEKEVGRLVDENLKLKRQCKQLKTEMAALIQPAAKSSLKRTSSTQF